ncbi:MAG: DUF5668 domain-containing protein [Candidatus Solibacter sp.]
MRDRNRPPSMMRAIRGPITLITIGILFALNNFTPYSFDRTWPVLLIVFGLLSLIKRSLEPEPPPPPVQPYPPPAYAYSGQPFPPPQPQGGTYTQSPYTQPPPERGGFGASAAKPADAEKIPPPPGETV